MLKQPMPSPLRLISGSALVVLLTLGFGIAAWAVQLEGPVADTKVTITLKNIPLREAAEKLVAQAGLRLGNPEMLVSKNKVTFGLRDEPIGDVLAMIGEAAGLTPEISDGVVTFVKQVKPVRGVEMPAPAYPKDALDKGIGGTVVMTVDVAADGSVSKAVVEHSEPAGVFDAAALDSVRKWKFSPKIEGGKAVPSQVRMPISFDPKGDPDKRNAPATTTPARLTMATQTSEWNSYDRLVRSFDASWHPSAPAMEDC